jgi:hypothetical protein
MLGKEFWSFLAILITILNYAPYLVQIIKEDKIPHYFSWIIWGSTTLIAGLAQLSDGAGFGSYPILVSGGLTLAVACLSYRKRKRGDIASLDWVFLVSALGAMPVWYLTESALSAIVILTIIDLLGFGPSFRKAWKYPFEESPFFYFVFGLRNIFVILALENYTWTTVLFPLAIAIGCQILVVWIMGRRVWLGARS